MADDAGSPSEETGSFAARVAAMRREETVVRTADMTLVAGVFIGVLAAFPRYKKLG